MTTTSPAPRTRRKPWPHSGGKQHPATAHPEIASMTQQGDNDVRAQRDERDADEALQHTVDAL
jgi:hypothetical protein